MKLEAYKLRATTIPVNSIIHSMANGLWDLSPAYQRGSVWPLANRVNLIESLVRDFPISAVYLNYRSETAEVAYCVDGKQRIETIWLFVTDQFAVPRDWFYDEDLHENARSKETVFWSDLTHKTQLDMRLHRALAAFYTSLPTEDAERELYNRVNYGGVPHEDPT